MIKEMKLQLSSSRKKQQVDDLLKYPTARGEKQWVNHNSTLDSTFYKTNRSEIGDSLKHFVNNSPSIQKVEKEIPQTFCIPKYYDRENGLFNSIYNEDKFSPEKEKKKLISSVSNYFNFNKNSYLTSNGKI